MIGPSWENPLAGHWRIQRTKGRQNNTAAAAPDKPSRSEAIRRLVELGLKAKSKMSDEGLTDNPNTLLLKLIVTFPRFLVAEVGM